jgi:hypothetical protein
LLIVGWHGWFVLGRDCPGGHALFGSRLGLVTLGVPGVRAPGVEGADGAPGA